MALRIAYVTSGMGHTGTAICQALHRAGHRVVAGCGPRSSRKRHWLEEQKSLGYDFIASEGDATDWASTEAAFDKVRREVGEIDGLVNNAGSMLDMRFRQMTHADWSAKLRSNLDTLFNSTKQVVDRMAGLRLGPHHQHRFGQCGEGPDWPGELRHRQGRGHRLHALAGSGGGGARRDRQPGVAGLHRRRHREGVSAGAAGPHRRKRARGPAGHRPGPGGLRAPGWPPTRPPSSRARTTRSTAACT